MITTIINYVHDPIDKKITLSDFTSITLEQFIAIRNLTRDVYIYKLTDTTNFGGSVFSNVFTYTVNSESFSSDDTILIQYDDFELDNASAVGGSSSVTGTVTTDGTSKITDGTNIAAVKGSNTPPLSADPALVVTLSPNSQFSFTGTLDSNVNINAGTNLIGNVGIDQTTPGTTNKVSLGSDVVHVIVDSGVTTGLTDAQLRATPVPVSGTVGANATLSAETTKVIGTINIAASQNVGLSAGSNAIGKLAPNSGVDIGDVDVTSLPSLVAGNALIGKVGLDQTTPGTTNKVSLGSDVVHVIVDSGVTTGLTDAQLRATPVPISAGTLPLPTDASTDSSLILLRRITKLLETLSIVDSAQRQRIALDNIAAGVTLPTVTSVGTVSTVTNAAAIAGMDREMYINQSRNTFANAIRSKLTFS